MWYDRNKQRSTLANCQQRHSTWRFKSPQNSHLQLSTWVSVDTVERLLVHTEHHWSQFTDKQYYCIRFRHFTNPSETVGQSSSLHWMHHLKHHNSNDSVRQYTNCRTSNTVNKHHNNHRRWSCTQHSNVHFDIRFRDARRNL